MLGEARGERYLGEGCTGIDGDDETSCESVQSSQYSSVITYYVNGFIVQKVASKHREFLWNLKAQSKDRK